MIDPRTLVRRRAAYLGMDPDIVEAVSLQESGGGRNVYGDDPFAIFGRDDPRAVTGPDGRRACSLGPFQENVCGGAGETHLSRGGALADLFDPESATDRFVERYRAAAGSAFDDDTPGTIVARAQRPVDADARGRGGYARSVDAIIASLRGRKSDIAPSSSTTNAPTSGFEGGSAGGGGGGGGGGINKGDPGFLGIPGALADLGESVEKSVEGVREGATQFGVAVLVIGAAAWLGYIGLRKTIG